MKIRAVFPLLCLVASSATAEVVRIDVQTRTDVAEGKSYGLAGPYERLVGKIYFEVDPGNPVNQIVADIEHAPRNAHGRVEFSSDFYLIKPKDIAAGNGAVFLDILNRGGKGMLSRFNFAQGSLDPVSDADMGDGFLLRHGFSLLWVGWQLDPPPRDGLMRVYPPIATNNGDPIEGLVRSDFVVTEKVLDHSLADRGHIAYPVMDPEDGRNVMTVRDSPAGDRRILPREQWSFARAEGDRAVPDARMVYQETGFVPGQIYEVVYVAKDPPIAGLGLAAIRDTISLLKYGSADALAISAGAIDRSLTYGASQSGRFLRTFLYDGFNEDEHNRKVFDGVISHIAGGGRGSFNFRFAQPSRASGTYFYPIGVFPFTDAVQTDPETGRQDGLLAKVKPATMPKIFYTNSSTEYWRRAGALIHTTLDSDRDVVPPDNVRIYHFAGTQHGPGAFPPRSTDGNVPENPNNYNWFMRSLLLSLDRWLTDQTPPPPSRHATLEGSTLVPLEQYRFPKIPGVVVPTEVSRDYRVDYGPRFATEKVITKDPPDIGSVYPFLVPQVDDDGNEISGLRSPDIAAPLATYTGWYQPDPESGRGLYLPLAQTRAAREASGDPRPSIEERYRSRAEYIDVVEKSARGLIQEGYYLADDLPGILQRAGKHWDYLVLGSSE